MSWYDPTSWGGAGRVVGGVLTGGLSEMYGANGLGRQALGAITSDPGADAERLRKQQLYAQAQASGNLADNAQAGYYKLGTQGYGALDALQRQAQGQNSVSALQLQQGLQQLYGQQQSFAAGASPQNAAMAARTAALQMGRAGMGMAGQQALSGLQERNQAQSQYAQLLQGLRGQDAQTALGARQGAIQGYGAGNAGTPEKSWLEKYGPAVIGGLSAAGKAGA
jgi:hypothetical protein